MKNTIVTGASRGIGYYTALQFAKEGHQVLAVARSKDHLEALKSENEAKGNIKTLALDLSSDYNIEQITSVFTQVDVLINNAGALINKPFSEITQAEMQEVYQTNVFAPYFLVQKLLSNFASDAHIINIGSVGGVNGTLKFPGLSIYSSSKAAASCLSECWQAEFAETDLTFNSLALGSVQTEMLEKAFPGYKAPLSPEQMATYVCRFALNEAEFVRGKTVVVSRTNP
ncbi:SDR family NAD(P)-dependent oxidoreductase [Owenweeksia hongkongensis]|uniref:SDR family NAD(P)-dependent oxidoreductase n=1 Tax=Owenweeksia hongkongensis TaxID=253245 RepID=UPI003A92F310